MITFAIFHSTPRIQPQLSYYFFLTNLEVGITFNHKDFFEGAIEKPYALQKEGLSTQAFVMQ